MFNTRPLGLKIFGVVNIITGLVFFIISSIFFYMVVICGWVADRRLYGVVEWICLVIINRLAIAIFFVFSFQLIRSGIALLMFNNKARKIAQVASLFISLAFLIQASTSFILVSVYHQERKIGFDYIDFIMLVFILYTILLFAYFNRIPIKQLFNDQNVKVSFIRPILIIIISFLFPFIVNLLFPVFPKDLIFKP